MSQKNPGHFPNLEGQAPQKNKKKNTSAECQSNGSWGQQAIEECH